MFKDIKRECKTCKNPYCSRTLEERQKREVQVHFQYGWECSDKEMYLQNDGGYALVKKEGFEIICKELEQEKKLNTEIKARFVKCNTCTDEMKSKCLMFSENLCEGERCEELVNLISLINKG